MQIRILKFDTFSENQYFVSRVEKCELNHVELIREKSKNRLGGENLGLN